MSMFIIARNVEFTVMLADNLAHRTYAQGNKAPLPAPKLTHVAPCIFATYVGVWEPAHRILSSLHDFTLSSPRMRSFEAITEYLSEEGRRCYQQYCQAWGLEFFDLRIPLVLTGPYRHPEDVRIGMSSTILIFETGNDFTPKRVEGAWFAIDGEVTSILSELIKLPTVNSLLHSSPLAMAQVLKALHSFVAHISVYVSQDCSIVVIGDEDQHMLISGIILRLPMKALRFG